MKIGLLSDTHGYLDINIFKYFKDCDEIWHAGDIGTLSTLDQMTAFKPVKAVFGNIDDSKIRNQCPENLRFNCEGMDVWITHIGGYPPKYNPRVLKQLQSNAPDLLICGHSHILKIMSDPNFNKMIYINPGAAGKHGFHKIKTMARFDIEDGTLKNLQVIELGNRSIN